MSSNSMQNVYHNFWFQLFLITASPEQVKYKKNWHGKIQWYTMLKLFLCEVNIYEVYEISSIETR